MQTTYEFSFVLIYVLPIHTGPVLGFSFGVPVCPDINASQHDGSRENCSVVLPSLAPCASNANLLFFLEFKITM